MMRTGTVRGAEMFDVTPAVAAVGRDRVTSTAPSELRFRQRAAALLERDYPGCSDGFVDYVTNLAWDAHVESRVRLEVSPAAVGLLTGLVSGLSDAPGSAELQAAVAAAAERLGWAAGAPGIPESEDQVAAPDADSD